VIRLSGAVREEVHHRLMAAMREVVRLGQEFFMVTLRHALTMAEG